MMSEKPIKTSTPNPVKPLRSRRPIHESESEILSPITSQTKNITGQTRSITNQTKSITSQTQNITSQTKNITSQTKNTSSQTRNTSSHTKITSTQGRNGRFQENSSTPHSEVSSEEEYDSNLEAKVLTRRRRSHVETSPFGDYNKQNFDEDEFKRSKGYSQEPNYQLMMSTGVCVFFVILIAVGFACPNTLTDFLNGMRPKVSLKDIQRQFPSQKSNLWLAIGSGVDEIKRFNKPSVLFFLYNSNDESTLNRLLAKVTEYASCELNNCVNESIILSGADLEKKEFLDDYGEVIHKYRPLIEERKIMVVKDVDTVPGEVAQAFHSMCDEFNPLVKRSLYIFTMKVDEGRGSNFDGGNTDSFGGANLGGEGIFGGAKIVDSSLRKSWSKIKKDKFEPLLTRITSMIVRISSEST